MKYAQGGGLSDECRQFREGIRLTADGCREVRPEPGSTRMAMGLGNPAGAALTSGNVPVLQAAVRGEEEAAALAGTIFERSDITLAQIVARVVSSSAPSQRS